VHQGINSGMPTKGVFDLYLGYIRHLSSRSQFIAPLQLTGRLEYYLVHEFIGHAFQASGGQLLGKTNLGNKGEPKIDIAFVEGSSPESERVSILVEAKYLQNAHRTSSIDDALDEISTTLKGLSSQLYRFTRVTQGTIPVRLRSLNKEVYGLVFASYTKPTSEKQDKEEFYRDIIRKATTYGFRYHDLPTPRLHPVYDDVEVRALGTLFRVSLRSALWRAHADDDLDRGRVTAA
jgi:hypothetical protein